MQLKGKIAAISCGLAFALAPAFGQAGGGAGGGGGRGAAPVPQYWLADADIFIGNGIHTASVMRNEQRVSIIEPSLIGNQARFLNNAISRALRDMQSLNANAQMTAPQAVPAIRTTIGHLVAAQAQASELSRAAAVGNLGPTYMTTVSSALAHLENATRSLSGVARVYPGGYQVIAARMVGVGGGTAAAGGPGGGAGGAGGAGAAGGAGGGAGGTGGGAGGTGGGAGAGGYGR